MGATHEVTGSCTYLEACGKHILIDCGMEQGPDEFENQEIPVAASDIDMVLLTHAHIDHSGKLPLCTRGDFGDRFLRREQLRICVILCCETVHTYRCLRRNGRTEKDSVPAGQKLCHCMISTMHRERSTVLLDAIMTKNQPCRWNLHSVCGCRPSAWLFFHRDLDQRERCGEKDCIFRGYRQSESAIDP